MSASSTPAIPRNPGPSWGCGFLLWAERWWPRWLFRPLLMAGTWIALAFMPAQRAHSRAYLTVVLGRPARPAELWRHFLAYADSLMFLLRAASGLRVNCALEPENATTFETLMRSNQPALFGSFHFGGCDLLGYLLGTRGRRVSMIRLRVDNSTETRLLGARFSDSVSFIWVNDAAHLLFGLKVAIEAGESLALKCDRLEFSARAEAFDFLGARRLFPFTIYHLALLFDRPVVFCTAIRDTASNGMRVFASPVFTADPAVDREANFRTARRHFQAVLAQLEILVRAHPFLWFNFLPLNPEEPSTGNARAATALPA
jgi:predicted LPLAT superfamily acyltransferase